MQEPPETLALSVAHWAGRKQSVLKKFVVPFVAVLICAGFLLIAVLFGYGRYKSAKAQDATFSSALQDPDGRQLTVRMPAQLANPAEHTTPEQRDTIDRIPRVSDNGAP